MGLHPRSWTLFAPTFKRNDSDPADLAVVHARVFTSDASRPGARAVAVKDGRITFVGDDKGVADFVGPETKVIDGRDRVKIDRLPLQKVGCPTLVVHGKKDADVRFSDGEYAASTIPGAEHYWIETGTHFGFWLSDQAEDAQKTAVDFLRKHLVD